MFINFNLSINLSDTREERTKETLKDMEIVKTNNKAIVKYKILKTKKLK